MPVDPPNPVKPRRPLMALLLGAVFYLVTFAVLLRSFTLDHWNTWNAIVIAALLAFLVLLCGSLVVGGVIAILSEPPRTRGLQCRACAYPLGDIPEDSPCPECGGTERWREYNVEETLDDDAIEELLTTRERALEDLLRRLPGRAITGVAYADDVLLREPCVHEFRELHALNLGIELTLDDHSTLHAKAACPPCYYLSLLRGPIDGAKHDVTSTPAWAPFLGVPIAHVGVQRRLLPMDLLQPTTAVVEVPIDVTLTLQDGKVLILAAREYDPGPPETIDTGGHMMLLVFGSERATELGFEPPSRAVGA